MPKVYLSPSNQTDNSYAYGNTNEAVQCGKIAQACKNALERCGFEVMLGQYDTMANRCAESDKFGAQLHVPIHSNAYDKYVSGTRMFCSDFNGEGYKACKAIFDVLAPYTPGTSENIKEYPGLFEIKVPKAPTAYIEVDFHSVPSVAKWIIEHTTEIGEKIAEGICHYFGVDYKTSVAPKPTTSDKLYKIQVGAFRVKANAEAMLAKLKAAGFDGYIKQE